MHRLFWSGDERFLKQFRGANLRTRFKPYSKFPPCFKDVSFWVNDEFTENNLCEVVRGIAGAVPRWCIGVILPGVLCESDNSEAVVFDEMVLTGLMVVE